MKGTVAHIAYVAAGRMTWVKMFGHLMTGLSALLCWGRQPVPPQNGRHHWLVLSAKTCLPFNLAPVVVLPSGATHASPGPETAVTCVVSFLQLDVKSLFDNFPQHTPQWAT